MKFDGYRILASLQDGRVALRSRRNLDWTAKFPGVAAAVAKLPVRAALLDGEVAVPTPDGRTSFGGLQEALSAGAARGVVYFAFDLLHLDGQSLVKVPLEERKEALRELLRRAPAGLPLRFSDHVIGRGPEFFAQVRARGLEGIVSKRRRDVHREGRSAGWLKIKAMQRQEFVVGGYTEPEGSRIAFGSLVLGAYDDAGQLVFTGAVGTGFTDKQLGEIAARMRPLARPDCPFVRRPTGAELRRPAHWVQPELVAEVEFLEWTHDGHIRHPAFRGLREDRDPRDVRRERPVAAEPDRDFDAPAPEPEPPPPARVVSGSRAPVVLGQKVTHPDRPFYPALGFSKLDLARYYEAVGAAMVPHVRGRPLTLVRCPEGVAGQCFYAKHVATGARSPLGQIPLREDPGSDADPEPYLVVRDEPGLVALAQLGVLEVHTWNSTESSVEHPDRFVMDLDPGPEVPWAQVLEAARHMREVLQAIGLESFLKTTGGKGLHVVVPLAPVFDWDGCLALSRAIAELIVKQQPRRYTTAMPKAGREAKILIDFYRNHRGATSIAAFSTRARPEATVSCPVAWDELGPGLRSYDFTVKTVPRRLAKLGADPWAGYWENRQTLRPDVAQLLGPVARPG